MSGELTGGRIGPDASSGGFGLDDLTFDERGLIPVVCQNVFTGTVLMVAWADRAAVTATLESDRAHFFSRSRQQSWRKGETSGNELVVYEIRADCDRDTLLYRVAPMGPTCHTGLRSCFDAEDDAVVTELELGWLRRVVQDRAAAADAQAESGSETEEQPSYTARLLEKGVGRIAQKVGEEGVETALAAVAANHARGTDREDQTRSELVGEIADLFFHSLVAMQACDIDAEEVAAELQRRHVAPAGGER